MKKEKWRIREIKHSSKNLEIKIVIIKPIKKNTTAIYKVFSDFSKH